MGFSYQPAAMIAHTHTATAGSGGALDGDATLVDADPIEEQMMVLG